MRKFLIQCMNDDGEWIDSGEGPFISEDYATGFAQAEVGCSYRIVELLQERIVVGSGHRPAMSHTILESELKSAFDHVKSCHRMHPDASPEALVGTGYHRIGKTIFGLHYQYPHRRTASNSVVYHDNIQGWGVTVELNGYISTMRIPVVSRNATFEEIAAAASLVFRIEKGAAA